jgi:NTE family protein
MSGIFLDPFFWAVISLFGVLGATAAVNTRYGKKFPWFGILAAGLFILGRFILVLPIIPQPRFEPSLWSYLGAALFGVAAAVFLYPGFKTQPLIMSQQNFKLRTKGLYSIVRHPAYLGEILLSFSISLLFRSIIGVLLVPIWWAAFVLHIIHEEERLELELGPYYLEYKAHVRGRIIPIPPFDLASTYTKYPFKNLVFKGGGVKGSAYLGAIKALYENGIIEQIERVAGSSAGAITATLLCFNRDLETINTMMATLNYQMVPQLRSEADTKEPVWLPRFIGKEVTRLSSDMDAVQRLISKFGWYSSEYFYNWLKTIIAENCNGNPLATFSEFRECGHKDLFIIATNLSGLEVSVFSFETTPNLPVADAVRMSMSIPLFFESIPFNGKHSTKEDIHVDGGVLLNYPIHLFDHSKYSEKNLWYKNGVNWETLGFYLYAYQDQISNNPQILNFKDYVSHLYECYNISLQLTEIDNNQIDKRRTVVINTLDVKSTEFNLQPGDARYQNLIDEGYQATSKYLQDYRHPSFKFN